MEEEEKKKKKKQPGEKVSLRKAGKRGGSGESTGRIARLR